MNYHIKDTVLSEKEFSDLKWCLGEYRRVCREQSSSEFGREKLAIAENLMLTINDIEWKNNNVK